MKRTKDLKMDPPSLAAQAQQHSAEGLAELVKIVKNTRSHVARLAAITTLLDRGFGKPPRSLEIATRDPVRPVPILGKEELQQAVEELDRRLRLLSR